MQSEIKFVYFDVGGVVIKDFSKTNKWEEMLSDLRVSADIRQQFADSFDKYEIDFCIGRETSDFVQYARREFNIYFPEDYDMTVDFVDRFEANTGLWPIIEGFKNKRKVGLLTNMYPRMLEMIRNRKLLPTVKWDAIIDSSIEGCMKPDPAIYHLAESRADVRAEEILFVDNSSKNIDTAKELGWQTFLYDPADVEESNKQLIQLLAGI